VAGFRIIKEAMRRVKVNEVRHGYISKSQDLVHESHADFMPVF
jgi:hypothetical protein